MIATAVAPELPRLPPEVARFRERYRQEKIGAHYSGVAHAGFTLCASVATITVALLQIHGVRPAELLIPPLGFLFGNLVEFLGHRGPMHHPKPGLRKLFQRHAGEHHRYYTVEAMCFESPRDIHMVLFPPVLLLFFLGGVALPLSALLYLLVSPNAGWLFVVTSVGYYLCYELLHFCHHLPPESWLGRRTILRRLREHHAVHHDPVHMQRWNFNITFPICDRIFGTLYRPEPWPSPHRPSPRREVGHP